MTNKNLEQKIKSSNKYGPTTPEEVDERKSYPDLYRRPYRRYGHTDSCPDND